MWLDIQGIIHGMEKKVSSVHTSALCVEDYEKTHFVTSFGQKKALKLPRPVSCLVREEEKKKEEQDVRLPAAREAAEAKLGGGGGG